MAKKKVKKSGSKKAAAPAVLAVPDSRGPSRVEQVSVAPNSVEFSRDAKGVSRWTIKVYCETTDLDRTVNEVLRLDARLTQETRHGDPV